MRADQDLVPKGLKAESLSIHRGRVDIRVAPTGPSSACPVCGRPSRRVHSRYVRKLADLPWHGTPVVLRARVRRFFCDEPACERRIFCERLPDVVARARKTGRMEAALLRLAFELGGRAGSRLASELGLLVSRDSLLRRLRRSPTPAVGAVRVLGVDDWAARKGERYGTILVDLERRRVVDLLPDRSAEALSAWLEAHGGGVEVVSRDRYRPYAEGASAGAPGAVQVADRFHVMRNLYDAVEKLVERNRRGTRPVAETPPARAQPPDGPRGFGKRADLARRRTPGALRAGGGDAGAGHVRRGHSGGGGPEPEHRRSLAELRRPPGAQAAQWRETEPGRALLGLRGEALGGALHQRGADFP